VTTVSERLRGAFLWICWVPAALLSAYWIYVAATAGWGALAGAYLIVASFWLSLALAVSGTVLWLAGLRRRGPDPRLLLAVVVSAAPLIWGTWAR